MVRACIVCQGQLLCKLMILAIIGTAKDNLVFYSTQIVDGGTDGKLNSYTAPCYKQVR